MAYDRIRSIVELATGVSGPPYDLAEAQDLCNLCEQALAAHLETESTWSRYAWLDGFVPAELRRDSGGLIVRGGVWVNAMRPEPCEVEVQLDEPRGATLRFMDHDGLSEVRDPSRLRFPAERIWRYVFHLKDRSVP
jgi:hypothetical protein